MKLEKSLRLQTLAYRSRVLIGPLAVILLAPLAAHAQGSPFDNGFTALQTLFTGTIAKVIRASQEHMPAQRAPRNEAGALHVQMRLGKVPL